MDKSRMANLNLVLAILNAPFLFIVNWPHCLINLFAVIFCVYIGVAGSTNIKWKSIFNKKGNL